ncbi:MAG TPA: SigE family RNA polymerase sigma factor [Acidimicrobiales bacterium]|nr:SigE family RNA polymerase sigma factor [Acidimicrobiales bacterium]
MLTDGATERATRAGGFEALYVGSYDRLVRLARLTSADGVPAEEIVQDAFVQLYRRWADVREPAAYLRLAVVNGCRSWGRRRLLLARRGDPPRLPEPGLDGDALAVRQALATLSPRQRAAVVLRYFEDLPEAEIARALGCRPGTVKSLLSRSLAKLKGALDDD